METKKTCKICGCILLIGNGDNWQQDIKGNWYCDSCCMKNNIVRKEGREALKERQERYEARQTKQTKQE